MAKKATANKKTAKGAAKPQTLSEKFQKLSMGQKVGLSVVAIIVLFFGYVSIQPNEYIVERQITIEAPAARVFPHINDFHNWAFWYPWAKMDPNQTVTIEGKAGVGSSYHWSGNDKVGEGTITITNSVEDSEIDFDVDITKPAPMKKKMTFLFALNPADSKPTNNKETGIKWRITGKNTFMDKLNQQFVSLDDTLGKTFQRGLEWIKVATQPGYQTNEQ